MANFAKGRVDIFDNAFQRVGVSKKDSGQNSDDDDNGIFPKNAFMDERLPRNYVPFNVQAVGNDIVVTYVFHEEGSRFETDGQGLGFVDIYSSGFDCSGPSHS